MKRRRWRLPSVQLSALVVLRRALERRRSRRRRFSSSTSDSGLASGGTRGLTSGTTSGASGASRATSGVASAGLALSGAGSPRRAATYTPGESYGAEASFATSGSMAPFFGNFAGRSPPPRSADEFGLMY